MELWGFKGLKKLEKTNIHVHLYKFVSSVKQSTAENFVYGELGRRPCQFGFRWRQVKFWNRLIGLPQTFSNLFNNSSFVSRTQKIQQRKLTSCFIGTADNKFQIVILTPRSREIFINCLISCDTNKYWRLQTGNRQLDIENL